MLFEESFAEHQSAPRHDREASATQMLEVRERLLPAVQKGNGSSPASQTKRSPRSLMKQSNVEKSQEIFDELSSYLEDSKGRMFVNVSEAWASRALGQRGALQVNGPVETPSVI